MEPKRAVKSKEEIVAEMKGNADFQRKMEFIKTKFWPALCKASTNIEDAQMLLEGFNTAIMQAFLGDMKKKSVKDLELGLKLDTQSDRYLENRDLLELFSDQTVFEAKEYVEGMKGEISLFLREEQKERPLSSLKVSWIDEIV